MIFRSSVMRAIMRSWTSSSLTLDERIANINGVLRYERPAHGHDEL